MKNKEAQNTRQWELQEIEHVKKLGYKPKLLMQSCCAVCNAWPLEYLHEIFDITLYYNNSNIYPAEEYENRLGELRRYVEIFNDKYQSNIQIVDEPYDYESYKSIFLEKRKDDKEGRQRCGMCYSLRITQALKYADTHDFEYVTTVMTISRQKSSQKINEIATRLAKGYPNIKYFFSDFKKANGLNFSITIAKDLGIYRQEYCGCEFSIYDRHYDV